MAAVAAAPALANPRCRWPLGLLLTRSSLLRPSMALPAAPLTISFGSVQRVTLRSQNSKLLVTDHLVLFCFAASSAGIQDRAFRPGWFYLNAE